MSSWPSSKARQVLSALYRIGWTLKRQSGSHKTLYLGHQSGISIAVDFVMVVLFVCYLIAVRRDTTAA